MGLATLNLQYKYRSDFDSIHEDFYDKCIVESQTYDRAAGYFSSDSLKLIARGLEVFLYNGGKVRIIANPFLSEADLKAIVSGYEAREKVILSSMIEQINITAKDIQDETLNTLAWLISEKKLEIRIAFTENNALYHEKFGIFTDHGGHSVAFSGSANETAGGILNNFEKIDVYTSPLDSHRIRGAKEDFENLWSDSTNGLIVKKISQSICDEIMKYKKDQKPPKRDLKDQRPKPRDYQQIAIKQLQNNNWQGILEMATGTGKTITSLIAYNVYRKIHGRAFGIIIVPFKHLVDQWRNECEKFGLKNLTLCYESSARWIPILEQEVRDFNINVTDEHVVITTYDSAMHPQFLKQIQKLQRNAFLIADECHYLGSNQFRNFSLPNIQARLGLSATPDRWWDESGTNFLKDFFDQVVYSYSLERAIEEKKLTPYKYHPHVVPLTEGELTEYNRLTRKIIQYYNQKDEDEEQITQLNRKRALILAKANQKIPMLLDLLEEKGVMNISHTIVYCAENQVNVLTKLLSEMGLRVHKFDSTVNTRDRQTILSRFADGELQVLVAIKCLDEGVDVPSTRCAYFLASTSNPREFVQRRGRILRKHANKHLAEIHDFIVFPEDVDSDTFIKIAKKELPRFAEFANPSLTPSQAKNVILPYISQYNLNHLMDMKPWDVYREMKEEFDNDFN
ncbi:DEAD/DEAH box helicase family protein [Lysinibacillus xylanilyticus]|uniref:DEAD/DEAH box helicase family protein n=1 Tax=Lysinibacillus xylanilyticus TaxID=582475 RepID=UPI003CFEE777